jgi:hypothetical protein
MCDKNPVHAGITDVVPHTYPPHRWLQDYMKEAYAEDTSFENFCQQLDKLAVLQGWERDEDEKEKQILNPAKDDFLQGVSALLQLHYHDFPTAMVRTFHLYMLHSSILRHPHRAGCTCSTTYTLLAC